MVTGWGFVESARREPPSSLRRVAGLGAAGSRAAAWMLIRSEALAARRWTVARAAGAAAAAAERAAFTHSPEEAAVAAAELLVTEAYALAQLEAADEWSALLLAVALALVLVAAGAAEEGAQARTSTADPPAPDDPVPFACGRAPHGPPLPAVGGAASPLRRVEAVTAARTS